MNSNRRITRSSTDRMIGGVCGGLGQYLGVDPTLVRIGFVLLTLAGVSPLAYIVLWIVMPSDMAAANSWTQQVQQSLGEMQDRASTLAREVSGQVQKMTTPSNPATPPADQSDQGPSTGPTTRF